MSDQLNSQLSLSSNTATNTTTTEPSVLTVEQANLTIKGLIENNVGTIYIKGEISNFKPHTSGHFYFSLKDNKAQINAMMFRGYNSKLKFKPHDGLEVIVRGKVTVYEPRGTYAISCEMMEPVGAGALQKQYEQLRNKLKLEGLFESSRKKKIPSYPKTIAVVTSPTGAAIQDILNIMNRRAKNVQVIVVPALVQGPAAAASLIESFKKAELIKPDVIIIGRGGGSIEDLWCFNDEALARVIAQSEIPVISAVGHEIDFTICDFVADLRAPTPSAAAELVSKSSQEIVQKLQQLEKLLLLSIQKRIQWFNQKLMLSSKRLIDPKKKLQDLFVRNDDLLSRLELAMTHSLSYKENKVEMLRSKLVSPQVVIQKKQMQVSNFEVLLKKAMQTKIQNGRFLLTQSSAVLDSMSPLKVVDRGYTIATGDNKKVIKSVKQVSIGDVITLKVSDGKIEAEVKKSESN